MAASGAGSGQSGPVQGGLDRFWAGLGRFWAGLGCVDRSGRSGPVRTVRTGPGPVGTALVVWTGRGGSGLGRPGPAWLGRSGRPGLVRAGPGRLGLARAGPC